MNATETTMPPYVRKTLNDIEAEIQQREAELAVTQSEVNQLQVTKTSLLELYGDQPADTAPKAKPAKASKRADATTTEPTASATSPEAVPNAWVPKAGGVTDKVLQRAKTVPQPFTAASLTVALKAAGHAEMDAKQVVTELWKLKRTGYVVEAGKEDGYKLYKLA